MKSLLLAGFLVFWGTPPDPCIQGAEALKRQELGVAETLLKKCLNSQPQQVLPYLQLCALYQLKNDREALNRIAREGLKRFPQEKRFYFTVGTHAGREKDFAQAIDVFSKGLRRWPDDPQFRKSLADSHASLGMEQLDRGKNEEAAKHLRRATELSGDDVEAHLNLGRALHNLNHSVEAIAAFDRVLALDGRLPLARFHRGLVLYGLGEFDAAVEDLRREIEINPAHPPSYLFRGLALMAKGDWAGALPDLETAALRMPDNVKAQYARARCLIQLGKRDEAEAALRKTLELDNSDPGPVNALARLLSDSGRREEAQQFFQKAAELSKKMRSVSPGEIQFESPRPPKP